MAQASDLTKQLLRRQNTDGGWGYNGSSSWTEPTALAVLALESLPDVDPAVQPACRSGARWLLQHQRADGGWSPNPVIAESTSVTHWATLGISSSEDSAAHARGLHWILQHIEPELTPLHRLEFWLQGMPPAEVVRGGSPWFPGTASWIAPTASSVFALQDACRRTGHSPQLATAIGRAQAYILSRCCAAGGWNHGGTQYHSETAPAYPEMTGMALLALTRAQAQSTPKSLHLAARMQDNPESSEGQSWLALGLSKHGRGTGAGSTLLPARSVRDVALQLLALSAGQNTNRLTGAFA